MHQNDGWRSFIACFPIKDLKIVNFYCAIENLRMNATLVLLCHFSPLDEVSGIDSLSELSLPNLIAQESELYDVVEPP